MTRFNAVLLPGGVLPAEFAYPGLVTALGPDVDARYKELELYAGDEPPRGWGLDTEVQGVSRLADGPGSTAFTWSATRQVARVRSRSARLVLSGCSA